MKKIMCSLAAVSVFAGIVMLPAGCDRSAETVEPGFELLCDSLITVSREAGETSIGFRMVNPGSGAEVSAECGAAWVSLNVGTDAVAVSVDLNEGEPAREAVISVTYSDADGVNISHDVTLRQEGLEVFSLVHEDAGSTWEKYSVTPLDPEMMYMVFVRKSEEMAGFASVDELFDADMAEYRGYAESYGMTLMELILEYNLYKKGSQEGQYMTLLQPQTEYCLYCYGISDEPSVNTAVYRAEFATGEAVPVDNQIVIEVPESEITDKQALVNIKPSTMDSYTMAVFTTEGMLPDEDIIEFLSPGTFQYFAGEEQFLLFEEPNTSYTVAVVGLAGNTPTTGLFKKEFRTKEAQVDDGLTVDVQAKVFDGDDVAVHIDYPDAAGKLVVAQKSLSYGSNVWSTFMTGAEYDELYAQVVNDPEFSGTTDEDVHVEMMNRIIEGGLHDVVQNWTALWFVEEEGEYVVMTLVSDYDQVEYTAGGAIVEVSADQCSPIDEYDSFMDLRPISL